MVLKEISQILANQRAYHPSVKQIEEMINDLSEDDWSELFSWMEAQAEEDYDPEPPKHVAYRGGGWY